MAADEGEAAVASAPFVEDVVIDGQGNQIIVNYFDVQLSRPDASLKFGMVISSEWSSPGGHAVKSIREGGAVHAYNQTQAGREVRPADVIVEANGKTSYEDIMEQLKVSLSCTLRIRRAIANKGPMGEKEKEAAKWDDRKARVTAALIPGLKKIVESEFGPGAGGRIGRVEECYQRVGRNEVFEEETDSGKRYVPGYVAGLEPVKPFHRTEDYPWMAQLQAEWKAIRKELLGCLDDTLWTPGAYSASNEAYGKDWKIMGVFTADKWQDEKRFEATTRACKNLHCVKLSEVFFAKMPPHTKIEPHSDNLNYILTSHLALDLEEGKSAIQVGSEEEPWREGEMLAFDTSFIHSTRNDSDRPRYILVVRFWHPGLTEEERRALHLSHAILAGASEKK